ncbi:MAG: alanine dehydrogenase [Nitrososphaerota archaeon]|nr:alanine dehydrogenase [Candidatus Bathyarchaeota archaeon]MDW8049009.1 alanine dehydrogenase [Nitrososphaerota archaeon]
MKVLILTERDIEPLLSMEETIKAVEAAFKEKGLGHVQMPSKQFLIYDRYGGDLRSMPSYLERLDISAVKIVNSHPDNPVRHGLPTVMATIILIEPRTGMPLAIMSGNRITAVRTGAAGGIAAKYLARKEPKIVGLVGAGTQAKTQLQALLTVYESLDEVKVWSRPDSTREKLIEGIIEAYADFVKITPVEKVREAVIGADIVVTTTPSRRPIVSYEWVSEGQHFSCIGADAPGKEELDPKILKNAKIVLDDWEQGLHSSEVNVPYSRGLISERDIWGDICEVVAGLKDGRTSDREITVFASSGLAIQDAATAKLVYDKAVSAGIGQYIDFM